MPVVKPSKFLHVGIPVNDLQRAKDFYVNVLGLEITVESRGDAPVRLHCGNGPDPGQQVILFKRTQPMQTPPAEEVGHAHHAFVVTPAEFDTALDAFKEMGIFHRGPIVWQPGRARTMYFYDPDGNYLQLADGEED